MVMQRENSAETAAGVFPSIAVDTQIMFSNHRGLYKRRIEKRQRKLVGKISFIGPFLEEDEKILQITTGCSPVSPAEQMLTGWIVFYLKRSVFVFTNKRIFHVPTNPDFSYRNSISQIMYGDCRSIAIKGRSLVAKYGSGKTEKFLYMAGSERKKIKALLRETPLQGEQSSALQRTHLCPRCTSVLVEGHYICPNCSLEFKNRKEARRISLLYPGGGYFYTRHPWLGLADAVVEVYLSVLVIAALIEVVAGVPGSMFVFALFLLVLGLEKALTVYHSNHFIKEYIPKDRHIELPHEETGAIEGSQDSERSNTESILSVR